MHFTHVSTTADSTWKYQMSRTDERNIRNAE